MEPRERWGSGWTLQGRDITQLSDWIVTSPREGTVPSWQSKGGGWVGQQLGHILHALKG